MLIRKMESIENGQEEEELERPSQLVNVGFPLIDQDKGEVWSWSYSKET